MSKNLKLLVAALVIAGTVSWLLFSGLSKDTVYYLEVHELMENPAKFNTKGMRVSGTVVEGTVTKRPKDQFLTFTITDTTGSTMPVMYTGIIPDAFEEGVDVVVEGTFNTTDHSFSAHTLLAKCPSKYEAEVEENTKG